MHAGDWAEATSPGSKRIWTHRRRSLQRVVLHEKLGKKEPVAEYAGTMLARVDQFKPAPVAQSACRISERTAARSRTRSADAGGLTRDAGREREVGISPRRGGSRSRFKRAGSPQTRRPKESRKRSGRCATTRKRPATQSAAFLRTHADRSDHRAALRDRRGPG